jgi:hypothetical protein
MYVHTLLDCTQEAEVIQVSCLLGKILLLKLYTPLTGFNVSYISLSKNLIAQNVEFKLSSSDLDNITYCLVSQFRYLGTTVTNQNLIQEEIKRRLNSGNAHYHSVQNLFF